MSTPALYSGEAQLSVQNHTVDIKSPVSQRGTAVCGKSSDTLTIAIRLEIAALREVTVLWSRNYLHHRGSCDILLSKVSSEMNQNKTTP